MGTGEIYRAGLTISTPSGHEIIPQLQSPRVFGNDLQSLPPASTLHSSSAFATHTSLPQRCTFPDFLIPRSTTGLTEQTDFFWYVCLSSAKTRRRLVPTTRLAVSILDER